MKQPADKGGPATHISKLLGLAGACSVLPQPLVTRHARRDQWQSRQVFIYSQMRAEREESAKVPVVALDAGKDQSDI
eukprot:5406591-Pleurochrysis_carterae.AAC.1